jgi:hypothetical protein
MLRVIPACGPDEFRKRGISEAVTLWQVAEALDTVDLDGVRLTLAGLQHLGYVLSAPSKSRKRMVFWRTPKGDGAVTA